MFRTCKRIARTYPNATLIVLGLACIILVEKHANAVFYAHYGIHYQNWTPHPLFAHVVDLWWWAEHRTVYVAAQILVTIAGAVMASTGTFRWVLQWVRRESRKKHSIAFWPTVVVRGVLLVYILSFGPASWLLVRCPSPEWAFRAHHHIYAPMNWTMQNGPSPLPEILAWYTTVGTASLF